MRRGIAGLEAAPAAIVDTIDRYRNEKRRAAFFTLRASSVIELPKPSAAQLAEFYDRHKTRYTQPANRTVSALIVLPEDVFDRIPVADSEIEAAYQQDKSSYTTPEKRTLRQLLFTTQADAGQVAMAMAGGRSFDTVAKEVVKQTPLSLGTVTVAEFADPGSGESGLRPEPG